MKNLLKRDFIFRNENVDRRFEKRQNTKGKILSTRFIFLLMLLCVFSASNLSAQIIPNEEPVSVEEFKKPRPEWMDKLHYGGNVWAGFFGSFYFDVSPMIGYEITKSGSTIAGLGGTFIYQGQFKGSNNQFSVGPRLFVRQALWRSFFAHAEYELINATANNFYSYFPPLNSPSPTTFNRKWVGSPLIGLGLYQGRNRQQGGSFISVMYNLGYPNRGFISPQGIGGNSSPISLRFGFFF